MIRNLKVLLAAAMALAALGALSASAAHAAEEKFHCSADPCVLKLAPDETAGTTTAHHVFVVKGETHAGVKGASVSFTCDQLTGDATVEGEAGTPGTTTTATFTSLTYENAAGTKSECKVAGQEVVTVNFTTCDYHFTSPGGGPSDSAIVSVRCTTVGDGIDINIKGVTCLKVTPFSAPGIGYHDFGKPNPKVVVTVTTNVAVPAASVDIVNTENATCKSFIGLRKIEGSTYTTGNTLVKAETEAGGAANIWFE